MGISDPLKIPTRNLLDNWKVIRRAVIRFDKITKDIVFKQKDDLIDSIYKKLVYLIKNSQIGNSSDLLFKNKYSFSPRILFELTNLVQFENSELIKEIFAFRMKEIDPQIVEDFKNIP